MNTYQKVKDDIKKSPKRWLITGVGGFIGSNVLEKLLLLNQNVVGLDNFSTGFESNLEEVKSNVGKGLYRKFQFYQADIRNFGSITRVAESAKVDAIIIPERGRALITSDSVKTSAGALNYVPICKVKSLKNTIKSLKDSGLNIVSCSDKATKNI